jgi:hypothetical protein
MDFVVNEWLPEYFKPDATAVEKQLLSQFIVKFLAKNDKIFVKNPSPFLEKLYRFEKYYTDTKIKAQIKFFIAKVLEDSERCVWVKDEIVLPDNIEKLFTGNFGSDRYLFEAAFQTETKKIITTDAKLRMQFEENQIFELVDLSIFLETY